MKEVFFKCTLKSDVVLNASLATEGNMTTLSYIPGSNFLGIVAASLYEELSNEQAYSLFHSGAVSFGDGTISKRSLVSYSPPFDYYTDKLKKDPVTDDVYLHHLIDFTHPPVDEFGKKIQFQQLRDGYFLSDGTWIKEINKKFSLKSAYDRETRSSKSGLMFGFEALEKGQEFIFSVRFKPEADAFVNDVVSVLDNKTHRLGKSKSAEYGQVKIEVINSPTPLDTFKSENYYLIYLQSNLCFFNKNGQPAYRFERQDLGLPSGTIDWSLSQVRTVSYSQWNGKRGTTNTQRFCLAKGAVLYVTGASLTGDEPLALGAYQSEGLGRVLYNPDFLEGDNNKAVWKFKYNEPDEYPKSCPKDLCGKGAGVKVPTSLLGKYLASKVQKQNDQTTLSRAVLEALRSPFADQLANITASQWGGIRALAATAHDVPKLKHELFNDKDDPYYDKNKEAYLKHGVAYDRFWGKDGERYIRLFKDIFEKHALLGTAFFVAFAAGMAKKNRDKLKRN